MDILDKMRQIKEKVHYFLEIQQSEENSNFFKYSLSGDIMREDKHWNVGSSVFAAKIAYIIGLPRELRVVLQAITFLS